MPCASSDIVAFGFTLHKSVRVLTPVIPYPIDSILPQLREKVRANTSVVLHAPPGAGKTTRVPLALLDLISPGRSRIVMLEPRRIAAVSAARWMAHLLGEQAGKTIGYSIRFDSRVSEETRIEVVSEGILIRRIQSDPGLEGIAMVIFDEFHERSLHADLALALCRDVQRSLRGDLKILIMSATLACGPISALLNNAPVITSEGQAYPVEERYLGDMQKMQLREKTMKAVSRALKETSGDILVFLPGSGEIRSCAESLRVSLQGQEDCISVHPLYGDLPFEEQEQAILPSQKRRIVLATNIAETSLTIEGVSVVIDSGLTRRLQHDPSSGMNRLVTLNVSRASADQRKGRAGRLGPGVCYRLYSEHTYRSLLPFSPPELLVSDLSSLVLECAVWGARDPSALSWLDAPPAGSWDAARRLLMDLGALDQQGLVTQMGRSMTRLPLHPRLGRLLLKAAELGDAVLGADLAAILSERDVMRRSSLSPAASNHIDLMARLDMLHAWRKSREIPPEIDPWALRSIERASGQLMRLLGSGHGKIPSAKGEPDLVPHMLLSAFPDRIAKRQDDGDGRFVLRQGRGVRVPATSDLAKTSFILAINVDRGEKADGTVHMAEPVSEELIRRECRDRIRKTRRIEWDKRERRIVAAVEERLDELLLSSKPFVPADDEAVPLLCEEIREDPGMLFFSREARQFQARVRLIRNVFSEEEWTDLSDEHLSSCPEKWLLPWLSGKRSSRDISALDILPALRAQLSWKQQQRLDELMPSHITVPSGRRIAIDYTTGDAPVLAVKLQEMFGLADTPTIAKGKVKVLLHLLSPAHRPVQVTQDLKGFWNSGYQQVKKELKGRYPKHPWPDDPWNAVPTRMTKPRRS